MRHFIFTVLLLMTCWGCASSGHQMSQTQVSNIVIGQTTKEDMMRAFGAPISQSYDSDGKLIMLWQYMHVGPFGTGIKQQTMSVLFDENEVVEKYNFINAGGDNGIRIGH